MSATTRQPRARVPAIHCDQFSEPILIRWLAHLVLDIGTGPEGGSLIFGHREQEGMVVAQRRPGVWSVSIRPASVVGIRYYSDPHVVARVILAREHDESNTIHPTTRYPVGDVTGRVTAELADVMAGDDV